MKNFRFIALLLAILMVAAVAFSCTGSNDSGSTTTPKTTTPAPTSSSSSATEAPGPDKPEIAEGMVGITPSYVDPLNLTEVGTKYWEYYSDANDYMKDAEDIVDTDFGGGQAHFDNKAPVSWTNGTNTEAAEEQIHGYNSGEIVVTVKTAGCKSIVLLVGAWNATNKLTVYDADMDDRGSLEVATAGGDAQMALVTVNLESYEGDEITIVLKAEQSNGGNVSLTAVAVN